MRRGWFRLSVGLAMLVLLSAACSDDDDPAGGPTTESSSTDVTSTTTDPDTTTTAEPDLPDDPPLRDDAVSGSGCTPGGGDLPSGWWYGSLESTPNGDLSFDLACYYIGAAAETKAAERGDEVNNDYYVVNDNAQIRVVPVADDAAATCVDLGAGVESVDCSPDEVAGDWAVWIRVQGGEVDRIVEQYAP